MQAPRTGGREPGQRGGSLAKQSPESGLQKRWGQMECVPTASGTKHLGGHKITALLRKQEGWRTKGRRAADPPDDRAQFGEEQRRSPAPSPTPIPQPKSQREPVPARELAPSAQTPNSVLLRSQPPAADLTPSRCHRAPPEVDHLRRSELSLPLLPLCTLPTHPS